MEQTIFNLGSFRYKKQKLPIANVHKKALLKHFNMYFMILNPRPKNHPPIKYELYTCVPKYILYIYIYVCVSVRVWCMTKMRYIYLSCCNSQICKQTWMRLRVCVAHVSVSTEFTGQHHSHFLNKTLKFKQRPNKFKIKKYIF